MGNKRRNEGKEREGGREGAQEEDKQRMREKQEQLPHSTQSWWQMKEALTFQAH